jgi:hypothetical protein
MQKSRDYKKEYQRRIANAAKRGLSRSQARGHARTGEAPIKSRLAMPDMKLEAALKALRNLGNQTSAARSAGVSPERLRRFLRENALAERTGKTWRITDMRPREMMVISNGGTTQRLLRGADEASLNGKYLNAVKAFLNSNDVGFLLPFRGRSVIDAKGQTHLFETDPNTLYRLAHAGSEAFHEIYRLIN